MWEICPQPFPEAHFAVFPEKLVETPIKAGCPEKVCMKCGRPRENIYETKSIYKQREPAYVPSNTNTKVDSSGWEPPKIKHIGYHTCSCNTDFKPGIVLDPFTGSGTTPVIAKKLGRSFIGIDIQPKYVKMATKRLNKVPERLERFVT